MQKLREAQLDSTIADALAGSTSGLGHSEYP